MNISIIKKVVVMLLIVFVIVIGVVAFTRETNTMSESSFSNNIEILSLKKEEKNVSNEIKEINYAIPIFMYHWIKDDTGDYPYPENMVKVSTLEQQLKYLTENGYESIYITDIPNITKYTKPVALTFDDGFSCFYYSAYPLLQIYNVKATVFVITDYVGKPGYCTKEQLEEMKKSGVVDIQAHTVTHPYLATLSVTEMYNQMKGSKDWLKNELDVDSTIICYPYGSYNRNTIEQAKNIGFTYGLAMDGGVHYSYRDGNYEISRIYANRSMNLNTFASYCSKSYVEIVW